MLSSITNAFFESKELYLGYSETAVGLGLMTGPLIGVFIYNIYSVKTCYIVFAFLIFLEAILIMVYMPSNPEISQNDITYDLINEDNEFENDSETKLSGNTELKVSYTWFFSNRRSLFAFMTIGITMLLANFPQSFLITYL